MSSSTADSTVVLFVLSSLWLLLARFLEKKILFFQRNEIPTCVTGGFLGLAILTIFRGSTGKDEIFGYDIKTSWELFPGIFQAFLQSSLFLGLTIPPIQIFYQEAMPQLIYSQVLGWGQYIVGVIVGLAMMLIFGVSKYFSLSIVVGLEGGEPLAGLLDEEKDLEDWAQDYDAAENSTYLGTVLSIVIGIMIVNKVKQSRRLLSSTTPKTPFAFDPIPIKTIPPTTETDTSSTISPTTTTTTTTTKRRLSDGEDFDAVKPSTMSSPNLGTNTDGKGINFSHFSAPFSVNIPPISHNAANSQKMLAAFESEYNYELLSFTFGLNMLTVVLALGLRALLPIIFQTDAKWIKYMPLYPLILPSSVFVKWMVTKIEPKLISPSLCLRVFGLTLDYFVVSTISIVEVDFKSDFDWVPFLIVFFFLLAWNALCFFWFCPWLVPSFWFERGLIETSRSVGDLASGYLLARMIDVNLDSPVPQAFCYKVMINDLVIHGGFWTVSVLPLVNAIGLGWILLISFGVVCLFLLAWYKLLRPRYPKAMSNPSRFLRQAVSSQNPQVKVKVSRLSEKRSKKILASRQSEPNQMTSTEKYKFSKRFSEFIGSTSVENLSSMMTPLISSKDEEGSENDEPQINVDIEIGVYDEKEKLKREKEEKKILKEKEKQEKKEKENREKKERKERKERERQEKKERSKKDKRKDKENEINQETESKVVIQVDEFIPPVLLSHSTFLSNTAFEQVAKVIPRRYMTYDWSLLFSLAEHGCSIRTLYSRIAYNYPTVIFIRDSWDYIFGAFISCQWQLSGIDGSQGGNEQYYGDGECFLFTFQPMFSVYKWDSESGNRSFILTSFNRIAFGSPKPGLCLDNELYYGTSECSQTYNNQSLSSGSSFKCVSLEIWTLSA